MDKPTDPDFRIVRILGFPYVTGPKVARLHLYLLAIVDWATRLVFGRRQPAPPPPLAGKTIAVAKIDLLGDVLIMSPLLRELRRQCPTARLLLVVGSWGADAARLLQDEGLCDGIVLYDPMTMSPARTSRWAKASRGLATFRTARAKLRQEKVDLYIDLRWSSPNSLLLAHLAGVPHLVGYGLRGCGYLLQQEIPFDGRMPMGQQYLNVLSLLGLESVPYDKPCLQWRSTSTAAIATAVPYLALHPFSRNSRKMISAAEWRAILTRLQAFRVVVIGTRSDRENTELIATLTDLGCDLSAVGATDFRQAAALVQAAEAFVGVDSVFSHVALAFDKPSYVTAIPGASFRGAFPAANPHLFYDVLPGSPEAGPASSPVLERFAHTVAARLPQPA